MYNIVLASGSPRRKEILEQVGVTFCICPSEKEEIITKSKPEEIVRELAKSKALEVAAKVEGKSIIIGADTMVALDGRVLGKPGSETEAKAMLQMLQGNRHQVYTGVSVVIKSENSSGDRSAKAPDKVLTFVEMTKVWVYPMKRVQIDNYIATGEPFDKAGGYGIQGKFAVHIEKIEGDYYNIVGFPIAKLYALLLDEGIDILSC
ncbi:Maf family protein [Anaerocolumna sp. AGMB13025]|uniref:Maf family protein n=1 Tax=Anaerocolumna sp. AGMB13025 TaxID=3039116 RepID=UPI00241FD882|nr:Maf family protein [Anaerocolumna sp. AGMB13025]WFR59714.1 Maf family protein [Anaerocolumna sp. AGMB13025]